MGIGVEGEKLGLDVPTVYIDRENGQIDAVKIDSETEKIFYRLRDSGEWIERKLLSFYEIDGIPTLLFDYKWPLGMVTPNGKIMGVRIVGGEVYYVLEKVVSEKAQEILGEW